MTQIVPIRDCQLQILPCKVYAGRNEHGVELEDVIYRIGVKVQQSRRYLHPFYSADEPQIRQLEMRIRECGFIDLADWVAIADGVSLTGGKDGF